MDTKRRVKYASSCVKKSKFEILMLCDDCLEHIFKWLPANDLCSIYETCSRFKDITEKYYRTFRSKTQIVQIPPKDVIQEKIIEYFGEYTRKLEIVYENTEEMNTQIVNVIKRCNEKIYYLDLTYEGEMSVPFKTIENVLINLKMIILSNGILGGELIRCKNVEYLCFRLCAMHFNDFWMHHNFPKLRALSIDHCTAPETHTFKEFLKKNPNIEHFTYRPGRFEAESRVWIPKMIINDLQLIREINFGCRAAYITKDLKLLSKCETLKNIQISVVHDVTTVEILRSFIDSLVDHKSLEGFVYSGYLPLEICLSMSKLTNLKVLGIYFQRSVVSENCFEILSKALIHLERLYIDTCNSETKHLLWFVLNSKKLKKMYLRNNIFADKFTQSLEEAILKRKQTFDGWPSAIYANKALASNIVEIFNVFSDSRVYTITPFEYEADCMFSRTFYGNHLA